MFKNIFTVIIGFHLLTASLWAITPQQLQQLAGHNNTTNAAPQTGIYQEAIAHLATEMSQTSGDLHFAHQILLQDICSYAGRQGAETSRLAAANALLSALALPTLKSETRHWLIWQLERIGKEEALPILTTLIASQDKAEQDYARRALEQNPASESTNILVDALRTSTDVPFSAALLYSLGHRRATQHIKIISQHLNHSHTQVVNAAAYALVLIHTPESISILTEILESRRVASKTIAAGLLSMANALNGADANALYNILYQYALKTESAAVQKAALMGLAANNSHGIDKVIIADFQSKDAQRISTAIAATQNMKSNAPAAFMAKNSAQLSDALKSQLITMLSARHTEDVMLPVSNAVTSNNQLLLQTAIDALSQRTSVEAAEMLMQLTYNTNVHVRKYAKENLIASVNANINRMLKSTAASGKAEARAGAMIMLGERRAPSVTAELLINAKEKDTIIFTAALEALAHCGTPKEIPVLCSDMNPATNAQYTKAAIATVKAILSQAVDKHAATEIVIHEINSAAIDLQPLLITTLSGSGLPEALAYCLEIVTKAQTGDFDHPNVKSALKTLGNWPDETPAKPLLAKIKRGEQKIAYAETVLSLAKGLYRNNRQLAKHYAKALKKLNLSDDINKKAEKLISRR